MRGARVAPANTDANPAKANTDTLTLVPNAELMLLAKKLPVQAPIKIAGANIPPGFPDPTEKDVIIGVIYRPPGVSVESFNNKLADILNGINVKSKYFSYRRKIL